MEFFAFVSNSSDCMAWCVWLSKLSSHVCWLYSFSGWKQDLGPKMQWEHKYCIKAELSTPFSSSVSECFQTFSIPIFRCNKRHQKLSSMQGSCLSFAESAVSSEAHRAQVWNLYLKSCSRVITHIAMSSWSIFSAYIFSLPQSAWSHTDTISFPVVKGLWSNTGDNS